MTYYKEENEYEKKDSQHLEDVTSMLVNCMPFSSLLTTLLYKLLISIDILLRDAIVRKLKEFLIVVSPQEATFAPCKSHPSAIEIERFKVFFAVSHNSCL